MAAQCLGQMRSTEALPGLLAALLTDPFWMLRCAIIQALEMIGDPEAILPCKRLPAATASRSFELMLPKRLKDSLSLFDVITKLQTITINPFNSYQPDVKIILLLSCKCYYSNAIIQTANN
jgi:hypothetical protein